MPRSRLVFLALVAACSSRPVLGPPEGTGGTGGTGGGPAVEVCNDFIDDDGNGLADCANPACAQDPHCPVCGDGLRQGAEVCDGEDLGGASCLSQHFNGGGRLRCTSQCALDTSGCSAHEDCAAPGDEDRNGLSDCADPACATLVTCLNLAFVDPPMAPYVTSARTMVVKVTDGSGAAIGGRPVFLGGPPGAVVPKTASLSDPEGLARFEIRMGRRAGRQDFVASLDGSDQIEVAAIEAINPPAGYVHTVLNADHVSGTDSSGPAVTAHVGAIVDLAVAADGTIYAAEACRILTISPEGELSVLAGTSSCGSAPDGVQASQADLSVAALALDESHGRLVFLNPSYGTARSVDLATGILSTLAGGGSGPDGGQAVGAKLTANALAMGKDGTLFLSDSANQSVREVSGDGVITTALAADRGCVGAAAVPYCGATRCRPFLDSKGRLFVAGAICGSSVDASQPLRPSPGIVRVSPGPAGEGTAVHVSGKLGGSAAAGQSASQVLLDPVSEGAFDGAGNLLVFSGLHLLRIDSVTWAATTLASWQVPTFGGELVPIAKASFQAPSALVFGGPDLYVADVDGTVRRVVNPGTSVAHAPLDVINTSGDGSSADLEQMLTGPLSVVVEDAGVPLADIPVRFEADDPGMAVYPGGDTDGDGVALRNVRMGMTPGAHLIRAFSLDIHGAEGLLGEVLTVTANEPPRGNIISLTSSDAPDSPGGPGTFIAQAGQILPSTLADFGPVAMALDPDGVIFVATWCKQILMIDRQGTLQWFGGIPQQPGGVSDADGGTAVKTRMVPSALAATRDAVYFLETSDPYRLRAIDRHSGIVTTLVGNTYFYAIAREADGTLLLGSDDGVERLDPSTGERTILLAAPADCSAGDGLERHLFSLAASTSGFFFAGVMCQEGQQEESIGSADREGTVDLLVHTYGVKLAATPDGKVAWVPGGAQTMVTDPASRTTEFVVGPADGFAEDVPASRSWAYNGGDLAYDPDGHLVLVTDQRIRIVW